MIDDILNAMGWSGSYPHCACCNPECRMHHFAPCVNRKHAEEGEKLRAADPERYGI